MQHVVPRDVECLTFVHSLTSADAQREILKIMSLVEKRMCYSIAFIPRHQQAEDGEPFANFVPGERSAHVMRHSTLCNS